MEKQGQLAQLLTPFLAGTGWENAHVQPIAGDASTRQYWRLHKNGQTAICMFMPPPASHGQGGERSVNLAVSVTPFVALSLYLRSLGLSAPEVYKWDAERGLALLEDLGVCHYGLVEDKKALYTEAVNALATRLHAQNHSSRIACEGVTHFVPNYCESTLLREVNIWGEWALGEAAWKEMQHDYTQAWKKVLAPLGQKSQTLVLRDFHSPNLLWCAHKQEGKKLGIIDFQDACMGHEAYDLVSLLQDAREEVPENFETTFLEHYLNETGVDKAPFREAYHCLGAQRATKIIGIFHRLRRRDNKPHYVKHIPRVAGYLRRNLEESPQLSEVGSIMKPFLNHFSAS